MLRVLRMQQSSAQFSSRAVATTGEKVWLDIFGTKPVMQQHGYQVSTGDPHLERRPVEEEVDKTIDQSTDPERDVWAMVFNTKKSTQHEPPLRRYGSGK